MKKKVKIMIIKIITTIKIKRQYKTEIKNIKKQQKLGNFSNLTKEEETSIDKLWIEHYGKRISKSWHKYYTCLSSEFNVEYFPEIFFTTNLLHKLNPPKVKTVLSDKVLTYSLFRDIDFEKFKLPNFYFYNCDGYYYTTEAIISKEEAADIIKNAGVVIIKPTVDTNSGNNVKLLNIKNGIDKVSGEKVEDILKEYGKNFIVQERIKPNKIFAKLNPSSINTVRINTYICDSKVHVAPISMRIGRDGNICDNAHAGGIQIGIKNSKLLKFAMNDSGEKFDRHPDTGVIFENYSIPRVNDMIEFAKKYHYRVPHIGCIAWDFTVDEEGYIVLIETNMNCPTLWFPQYTTGDAFFGENTVKMIENLNKKDIK